MKNTIFKRSFNGQNKPLFYVQDILFYLDTTINTQCGHVHQWCPYYSIQIYCTFSLILELTPHTCHLRIILTKTLLKRKDCKTTCWKLKTISGFLINQKCSIFPYAIKLCLSQVKQNLNSCSDISDYVI